MMAVAHVLKDNPPDLILSGVNRGANLAEDVTYSGTVSAAMEGALAGIPSIALSQVHSREAMGAGMPFDAAAAWGERVLTRLIGAPWSPRPRVTLTSTELPAAGGLAVKLGGHGLRAYAQARSRTGTHPTGCDYYQS